MPVMPRVNNKATKIAWSIIGKPLSINIKKKQHKKETDRRLVFEETTRVR